MSAGLEHCDLWLYPIRIRSGQNQITYAYTDGGGNMVVPPGTYYAYLDPTAPGGFTADYPSLYATLTTLLNALDLGTFEFGAATPTASSSFVRSGLQLVRDGGPEQFALTAAAGGFTFPAKLLGIAAGSGDGLQTIWKSAFSRGGAWQTPRPRSSSFAGARRIQFNSRGNRETRQARYWRTDHLRTFEYHWIPAGHVFWNANHDATYAEAAGLATNDTGNALFDLWSGLASFEDVIVVHNVKNTQISLALAGVGDGWSIHSAVDERIHEFNELVTLEQRTGAHFGVDIPTQERSGQDLVGAYGAAFAATAYRRGV